MSVRTAAMSAAAILALAGVPVSAATGSGSANGSSGAKSQGGGEGPPAFFHVYTYDQPFAGWMEANLWTTYIAGSDQRYEHFGDDVPREGLWAHSLEADYGVTDRFALGAYADVEDPHNAPGRFVRGRIVGRYRFANRYDFFFNPSLYFEYYLPRADYGGQKLEARLILDHDFNDFRVAFNPIVTQTTTGDKAGAAPTPEFDAAIYWRRYFTVQPGLEYYASFGPWGDWSKPTHYLFPVLNFNFSRTVRWQLGGGFGLSHASDDVVVKSIFTVEFDAIRPARLFGGPRS